MYLVPYCTVNSLRVFGEGILGQRGSNTRIKNCVLRSFMIFTNHQILTSFMIFTHHQILTSFMIFTHHQILTSFMIFTRHQILTSFMIFTRHQILTSSMVFTHHKILTSSPNHGQGNWHLWRTAFRILYGNRKQATWMTSE